MRRPPALILACSIASFVLPVASCSDDLPAAAPGAPSDAGDATPPADPVEASAPEASAADAEARGITLTIGAETHALAENARAFRSSLDGLTVQGGKTDGDKLYSLSIVMVEAVAAGENVEPNAGSYACSATAPSAPYRWARLQYTGPEGTFHYGDPGTCVTLARVGGAGEPVVGTFDATLARATGTGSPNIALRGRFDVDRTD